MITANIITTFAEHATTREEMAFVNQLAAELVGQNVLGLDITSAEVTAMSSDVTNGDWHDALQLTFSECTSGEWGWEQDIQAEVLLAAMIEAKSPTPDLIETKIIEDMRVSSGNSRPVEEAAQLRSTLEAG